MIALWILAFFLQVPNYNEVSQAAVAHSYFREGIAKAREGLDVTKACTDRTDQRWILCIEGYFYGLALDDFNNDKFTMDQIFKKHQSQLLNLPASHMNLWAVPFGIAQPYSKRSNAEVVSYLRERSPRLLKFYADGWALTKMRQQGLEKTLTECESEFGANHVESCAWGAGRSEFLYRPGRRAPADTPLRFRQGFQFARNFTHLKIYDLAGIEYIPNFPRRAAETIKNVLMERIPHQGSPAKFLDCVSHKYMTECESDLMGERAPAAL